VKGLSCLGKRVKKRITQLAMVIVSQMVVASGITTSNPRDQVIFQVLLEFLQHSHTRIPHQGLRAPLGWAIALPQESWQPGHG
jgi:hypothetical protein